MNKMVRRIIVIGIITAAFLITFILIWAKFENIDRKNVESVEGLQEDQEQITLHFFHYQSEALDAYNKVFDEYEELHPNIRIESEFLNSDNYNATLQARIAIADYPDIFGIHPGQPHAIPIAEAGYLEELTNQPCVRNAYESSLMCASIDGKVYAVPTDQSFICTFYNKEIFLANDLEIPKTWEEFLNVCDILKKQGIVPISLGYKDMWIEQLIPYAMAPTMIYKENADFDSQMYAGNKKFVGEEWNSIFERFQQLFDKGYVTENYEKVSYQQQLADFANGKAGMMIMGTWAVPLVGNFNPNCDFGLFIMPASEDGTNWIAASVGGMLAVSKDSPYKKEAIDFLNFMMADDTVYGGFLRDTANMSARMNFEALDDERLQQLTKTISGSYNFLDVNWPSGFQDDFCVAIENISRGEKVSRELSILDSEWENRQ